MTAIKHTASSILSVLDSATELVLRKDLEDPSTTLMNALVDTGLVTSEKIPTGKRGRQPLGFAITEQGRTALADGTADQTADAAPAREKPVANAIAARPIAEATENGEADDAPAKPKSKTRVKARVTAPSLMVPENVKVELSDAVRVDGYLTIDVRVNDDPTVFKMDTMRGAWAFNDQTKGGMRRLADTWLAQLLAERSKKLAA